jgi:L-alanine-DL-glutamate epimerase-like enolase superfamily enzyme
VGQDLAGESIDNYLDISAHLHERLFDNKSALAAIEMAMMDALTRQWKIPLWKFFGNTPKTLRTDITIVIGDLEETIASVKKYYARGFRAFKVKVGKDRDLDFKRLLAIKKIVGRSPIYLDANQAYTADETLVFLKDLRKAGIIPALLEQPVAKNDWEGLKKVGKLAKVPVCADESAGSVENVVRIIREKICPAVNIKLMKTGLFQSREIAYLAQANGIKLMIGAMMESSLSCMASAHLAAGIGGFDFIDLDTPFFLQKGFDKNPALSPDGIYDVRKVKAGIGIIPSEKIYAS